MAKNAESKSRNVPATRSPASSGPPRGPGDWVLMHLHGEWRDVTDKPEERVRQEFILHLHNDYGYSFEQMDQERSGRHGTFRVEYLDRRARERMPNEPLAHDRLFDLTKDYYKADDLFADTDRLEISEETFRRIVKELEWFDLSKTGDDIKGLAFERFLGSTFRGELGQFFTPRPVVDFMVSLLDPREGELICDPAAGSGGFLIRAFEHVRGRIASAIQADKDKARAELEAKGLEPEEEEAQIERAFAALNRELLTADDENRPVDTRMGRLAWRCIFGCDAEPRAARTAKMNMIMHGDGHGGIHHHDGLVDINGIFPTRFDVVMTNPPFGSNVGSDQKVDGGEETRIHKDDAWRAACLERYGDAWERSHQRMLDAAGTNILDLFEIGKGKANRATEIIFVERCLSLLKPGGRMGIVLPDGNLNNPSLLWLRRWCEGKARILAVVSLPEDTFRSADATVKASLVFFRRFAAADEAAWEAAWNEAHRRHDDTFNTRRDALCSDFGRRIVTGESARIEEIVDELAGLGVERTVSAWRAGTPPVYPRGIGPTRVANPRWSGTASDRKGAAQLKRDYAVAFEDDEDAKRRADALLRELRTSLRTWTKRTTRPCGPRCARCSTIRSSLRRPPPSGSPRPARRARTCRTICRSLSTPGAHSSRGSRPGPSRRTRRIFVCPPLPDPAVEGARALDRC